MSIRESLLLARKQLILMEQPIHESQEDATGLGLRHPSLDTYELVGLADGVTEKKEDINKTLLKLLYKYYIKIKVKTKPETLNYKKSQASHFKHYVKTIALAIRS